MKALVYGSAGVLGLLFGVAAFFTTRRLPLWSRYSALLAGVFAIGAGTLGYILESYRSSLPFRTRAYLDHYHTLLGGIFIGIFVVLIISGQLRLLLRRRDRV
jgi:uncharacterized membrane protein